MTDWDKNDEPVLEANVLEANVLEANVVFIVLLVAPMVSVEVSIVFVVPYPFRGFVVSLSSQE